MYAEMEAAEQGSEGEMQTPQAGGEPEQSHDTPMPDAGEAEAQQDTDTTGTDPQAGEAEDTEHGASEDDNDDGFKPSGRLVPVEKYTDLRRAARRLEKAKHGVEKTLGERDAELAQLKARLQYAEQTGATIPDLPDGIDVQAVQDGDPDAMRDALLYMQHTIEQLRAGNQQALPQAQQATQQAGQAAGSSPAPFSEPVAQTWDQFIWSLPEDSPVHELDGWMSSGDPVLVKAAQQTEQQLLNNPQFNASRESLYTEVVRRVKSQLSRSVGQQLQQAEQQSAPRSLSQAGGSGAGNMSLVEQFSQADDPEAFMQALPKHQQQALWAALGM
jgi:hypothetical protein